MWKYIPTIDEDKEAGTVVAQLVDDNDETKVLFQHVSRVTLSDDKDIERFIREAKKKAEVKDEQSTKNADYATKLADADTAVDAKIADEKAAAVEAAKNAEDKLVNP